MVGVFRRLVGGRQRRGLGPWTIRLVMGIGSLITAPPAHAGGGEAPKAAVSVGEETVAMPLLVVPVLRNGRLWGQAFMAVELVAPNHIWEVRSHVHELQDALVRTAHTRPLDVGTEPPPLGDAAVAVVEPLLPLLTKTINASLGKDLVTSLVIPRIFLRPL